MGLCLEYNIDTFGTEERESRGLPVHGRGQIHRKAALDLEHHPGGQRIQRLPQDLGRLQQLRLLLHRNEGLRRTASRGRFTPGRSDDGVGSAYDNDIEHRSVELISRVPGGAMIPPMPGSKRAIQFPGISTDGSHILMLTESGPEPGPPYHLYMRVNDAIHYDVSKGTADEFVGMTKNGSSVTFTSEEQLTANDEDDSIDLYRWSEATDTLTLLSLGNGNGNTNDCSASWIEGCGVEVPNTERRYAMLAEHSVRQSECAVLPGSGTGRRYGRKQRRRLLLLARAARRHQIRDPEPAQSVCRPPERHRAIRRHDGCRHPGPAYDHLAGRQVRRVPDAIEGDVI